MRTAVVTGAGRGLGRATAERLARDGYHVVALDLDGDAAAATAAAVGGDWRACDVTDAAEVRTVAEGIDGCDALVNNAGIWRFDALLDMTPEDAQAVLAVNVLGIAYASQAFAPLMIGRGGGAIVNHASVAALVGVGGLAAYTAAKGAVVALTRAMAVELGPRGVRVNCVCPGTVATPMTETMLRARGGGDLEAGVAATVAKYPIGRLGAPEDIAQVACFLASDDAAFVTGAIYAADGGMTAQ
jgi:NAD(P)-dependent dehydrogenase (short-subunit alcohol dehydrogenase family)